MMLDYPKVTYTMTSCRRLGHFVRSMRSFMDACLDLDLIDRWILNDDHSDPEDVEFIRKEWPFLEIVQAENKGQAAALNNLFHKQDIQTSWIFHSEDDWFYTRKGHFLREMLDIVQSNQRVKNVVLRQWQPVFVKDGDLEYYVHVFDHYFEPEKDKREDITLNDRMWYGYSLNPGLQHLPTLRILGPYDEDIMNRQFDRPVAKKYWQMGLLRANLKESYIAHTGWGASLNVQGAMGDLER